MNEILLNTAKMDCQKKYLFIVTQLNQGNVDLYYKMDFTCTIM